MKASRTVLKRVQGRNPLFLSDEYLHENGENIVRLAIIDAVTNLIINDQVMLQEDFDKEFLEIFLKYSLEGLPKKY